MTRPQWFHDRWQRLDVSVRDLPLAVLLLTASLIPSLHGNGTQIGNVAEHPVDTLGVAVAALQCLPLVVRRRWPVLCLALVSAGFALDQLSGYHLFAGIALPVALVSAGAHLHRFRLTTMAGGSVFYLALAIALSQVGSGETLAGFGTFYVALSFAWGIGAWLRSTRIAEAERRRLVAEATRTAERTRIARDLHDVVTHHVTAMVVQTEAARYLTAAPDRLDTTLGAVSDTGRRAITDLRHLLDVLDPGHTGPASEPDEGLLSVVEQTRRAGQPVEFTEEGTAGSARGGADLVVHRVVQEALTNALKYAYGSPTTVRVRHRPGETVVDVTNGSTETSTVSPGGSGRGLTGLRERVEALSGEFDAEPDADGGFAVHTRIPARALVGEQV